MSALHAIALGAAAIVALNAAILIALAVQWIREGRRDRELASILSTERSAPRRLSGRGA